MSFYSGPIPYIPKSGKEPHENWKYSGWNPIQSGDVAGNRSKVVKYYHGQDSIYVLAAPMQWPLENVCGECFFESIIKITDNCVKIHNRLINHREDKTQYPARLQELPAIYVNPKYKHLFTYKGNKPFKNDSIVEITPIANDNLERIQWRATENWVAFIDDDGCGLGIFTPGIYSYIGDHYSINQTEGSEDSVTAYCAPVLREILDHNITYDYKFQLLVGNLQQIREIATENRKISEKLEYNFKNCRNNFYYSNAFDSGWPIKGELLIRPNKEVVYINSPNVFYKLDETFNCKLKASFPTNVKKVSLICNIESGKSDEYQLNILNDGLMHDYIVFLNRKQQRPSILTSFKIKIEFDQLDKQDYIKVKKIGID